MRNTSILLLLVAALVRCTGNDTESERDRTIRLLTGNSEKAWLLQEKFEDEMLIEFTACDSAYQLNLLSDFTWTEHYPNSFCSGFNTGAWQLNEEGNVLTTTFQPVGSSQIFERRFEILEISEATFFYQYVRNNTLLQIKMIGKE